MAENFQDYIFWATLLVSGIDFFGPHPFKVMHLIEEKAVEKGEGGIILVVTIKIVTKPFQIFEINHI